MNEEVKNIPDIAHMGTTVSGGNMGTTVIVQEESKGGKCGWKTAVVFLFFPPIILCPID